jgi:hypothetical protein
MPFLAPSSAFLTPLGDTWRWYSLIALGPVNLGIGFFGEGLAVVLGIGVLMFFDGVRGAIGFLAPGFFISAILSP